MELEHNIMPTCHLKLHRTTKKVICMKLRNEYHVWEVLDIGLRSDIGENVPTIYTYIPQLFPLCFFKNTKSCRKGENFVKHL